MTTIIAPPFTEPELAAELRVNPRTLKRWRIRGDGPPMVRIGRRPYYSRAAVDKWLGQRAAR